MPYPSTLDTTSTIPVESSSTPLATNHVTNHTAMQTAIIAIETLIGVTGSVVTGTINYILGEITGSDKAVGKTATQTLTNKTLIAPIISSISNTGTLTLPTTTDTLVSRNTTDVLTNKSLSDNTTLIVDNSDNTKALKIDVTGTTGVTGILQTAFTTAKTLIFPDASDTLVGKATTDTLTNKTLTTPTITKPVMNATNPTAQTYSPTASSTATLDLSLGNQHDITMPAGNITIALSNDTNNQIFTISILQDGTGSRTVTWFSTIRWATGTVPTLTTTASKRDMFVFKRTGSGTYDGFIVGQSI